jgi:uncharacterized protein YjbI with pentapeptide repeats
MNGAILVQANLRSVILSNSDVSQANFSFADLRGADISNLKGWTNLGSLTNANIYGVKNAPTGFWAWATNKMGAVAIESSDAWPAFNDTNKADRGVTH